MTQPTGVFVRLYNGELSDQQTKDMLAGATDMKNKGGTYTQAMTAAILATGTPVTGGEFYPVGYIAEDAIGGLATGIYQSASIFRDEDKEHHDTVALVRFESAQAAIAVLEAEMGRFREALEEIEMGIDALSSEEDDGGRMAASEMKRQALEVVRSEMKALKGPEA